MRVWSIGHSTHPFDEFVGLLQMNGVERIADVRTVPKSLRNPQFHTGSLATTLPAAGIGYVHLERLGGWRKAEPDSPNDGWHNKSFRGYADYTLTDGFAAGLAELETLAEDTPTAMMCSEALWWRCHRRLVADRIVHQGGEVLHIAGNGTTAPRELTRFAVVDPHGRLVYPEAGDGPGDAIA